MLLSPLPASPVKSGEPLKTMPMREPSCGFHLGNHVEQEKQRPVIDAREAGAEASIETEVIVLLRDVVFLRLPLHAEGRIGQHVVEFFIWVAIAVGEAFLGFAGAKGVAVDDEASVFALDHEIGAADGVGLRVILLAEEFDVGARIEAGLGIDDEFL